MNLTVSVLFREVLASNVFVEDARAPAFVLGTKSPLESSELCRPVFSLLLAFPAHRIYIYKYVTTLWMKERNSSARVRERERERETLDREFGKMEKEKKSLIRTASEFLMEKLVGEWRLEENLLGVRIVASHSRSPEARNFPEERNRKRLLAGHNRRLISF